MLRVVVGGLVAGVIVFAWGNISWMQLNWHNETIHPLAHEPAVVEVLGRENLATGVYWLPGLAEGAAPGTAAWDDFAGRHRRGPIATIFYTREGQEPMSPRVFAGGLAINVLAGLIVATMMSYVAAGGAPYIRRANVGGMSGLFAALVGHLASWNWMSFPLPYTVVMMADLVIGWSLAGLAMALVIRPPAGSRPA